MIKVDTEDLKSFIECNKIKEAEELAFVCHKKVLNKTGTGSEYLGWVDLYDKYDREEFSKIKKTAHKIKQQSQVVIVIGIGGSYLGSKAAIHAIKGDFFNELGSSNIPKVYFSGCDLSSDNYLFYQTLIEKFDASLIMISKSGTTLEPAISFRILKDKMYKKYGSEASDRIYTITDRERGALKTLSNKNKYESFVVPDNIGGRYSVFTPVGLLPMAVAGLNIDKLYEGLKIAQEEYQEMSLSNACIQYAIARYCLYKSGKEIEVLLTYNPRFKYISEWWKQLFGESEGKDGKGLFPVSMTFTTDLHSLGQMLQDGNKIFFETTLFDDNEIEKLTIPYDEDNIDGLNYISGKTVQYVNENAYQGTKEAHSAGGVANFEIRMPKLDEFSLGKLFYFFTMSCAISGYMLDVNPFNQPGVEKYKKNVFRLLGKNNL